MAKKKKKSKWTENKAIGKGNGLVEDTMQDELKWNQEWQSQFDRGNANRILQKEVKGWEWISPQGYKDKLKLKRAVIDLMKSR